MHRKQRALIGNINGGDKVDNKVKQDMADHTNVMADPSMGSTCNGFSKTCTIL